MTPSEANKIDINNETNLDKLRECIDHISIYETVCLTRHINEPCLSVGVSVIECCVWMDMTFFVAINIWINFKKLL